MSGKSSAQEITDAERTRVLSTLAIAAQEKKRKQEEREHRRSRPKSPRQIQKECNRDVEADISAIYNEHLAPRILGAAGEGLHKVSITLDWHWTLSAPKKRSIIKFGKPVLEAQGYTVSVRAWDAEHRERDGSWTEECYAFDVSW